MSKMGDYLLDLEEIICPMVYTGHGDATIKNEVKKFIPDAPESWIQDTIYRARFDYDSFEPYA